MTRKGNILFVFLCSALIFSFIKAEIREPWDKFDSDLGTLIEEASSNKVIAPYILKSVPDVKKNATVPPKPAVQENLLSSLSTSDEKIACLQKCENGGVCEMGRCFCKAPFIGKRCQIKLAYEEKMQMPLFLVIMVSCFLIGLILAYLARIGWESWRGSIEKTAETADKEYWVRNDRS